MGKLPRLKDYKKRTEHNRRSVQKALLPTPEAAAAGDCFVYRVLQLLALPPAYYVAAARVACPVFLFSLGIHFYASGLFSPVLHSSMPKRLRPLLKIEDERQPHAHDEIEQLR